MEDSDKIETLEELYIDRPFVDNLAFVGRDVIDGFFAKQPNFARKILTPKMIAQVKQNPDLLLNT